MIWCEFEKKVFWYISRSFRRPHTETEEKRGGTSGLDDKMTDNRTGILQNAAFSKTSTGHGLF